MLQIVRLIVICCMMALVVPRALGESVLTGAGATFPYPLYKTWIQQYERETGERIVYSAVGSGAGIRQLVDRSVDFGATDAFLSDEELAGAPGTIVHVPTCLGAVTVVYNLPGDPDLRLTPDLIAGLFSGQITDWADTRIAAVNTHTRLPRLEITVVHRSDESGTTFIFTDYLSKVSPGWRDGIGRGKDVPWPAGVGLQGNPGVVEFVKKVPGSIGYVELTYAKSHMLPVTAVRNRSGNYIKPSLESVSLAADVQLPTDARILITDTMAPFGYPISSFTWLIVFQEQAYDLRSGHKAEALARFLWWILHEGQQYNERVFYARLPEQALRRAEMQVRSLQFEGAPLIKEIP